MSASAGFSSLIIFLVVNNPHLYIGCFDLVNTSMLVGYGEFGYLITPPF